MSKHIYLAWQDQTTRKWHVIGRLLQDNGTYEFRYTQGVKNIPSSFSALSNMPEFDKIYSSPELFSLFKNRLMPKSRPDYPDYIRWMGLKEGSIDELLALAISGGERETDFFRIIAVPEKNANGNYSFKFFVNGLSHMDAHAKEKVQNLHEGTVLYLLHDFQNEKDKLALSLRTPDPPCIIGYLPAYLTKVIHKIKQEDLNTIKVNVSQLNKDAPIQMRLLCELSFSSFKGTWEDYEDEFTLVSMKHEGK